MIKAISMDEFTQKENVNRLRSLMSEKLMSLHKGTSKQHKTYR